MKNSCVLLLLLLCPLLDLMAQNSPIAAGGDAQGSGGSSSFSIGQVLYQQPMGGGFSTLEGNQQPIEVVVLANTAFEANPQLKIYPNPVYSGFYIALPETGFQNSKFELIDLNGKIIRQGNLTAQETFVDTDGLTSGVYVLKVQSTNQVYGYKIIKQ